MTTVSVKRPFFEYSRLTVVIAPAPVELHEIVLTAPTVQTSVPTGAVTDRPPLIVKTALETAKTVASAGLVTRTLTLEEARSGTGPAEPPGAAGVGAAIRGGSDGPPSVEHA